MEKEFDSLAGAQVAYDIDQAHNAYPGVVYSNPLLRDTVLVPRWAVFLRLSCNRAGLGCFGRELLPFARSLYPSIAESGLNCPCTRTRRGHDTIRAALAVLEISHSLEYSPRWDAETAVRMLDVLEEGGMRYARPDAPSNLERETRNRKRDELCAAARTSDTLVPSPFLR